MGNKEDQIKCEHIISLIALSSWISVWWMASSSGSSICMAGCCFPNCGNIIENNTCYNNVTGPFRGYPVATLKTGFQKAYGHLHLGSRPAMGHIKVLLGAWIRVRGQQSRHGCPLSPSKRPLNCSVMYNVYI